jgi:hypothetical protein
MLHVAGGHGFSFYGMGTFSLDWSVSTANQTITAYGHVGDTYGYQSQTTYFPGVSPAPEWSGWRQRCPVADVAGVGRVSAQMWHG